MLSRSTVVILPQVRDVVLGLVHAGACENIITGGYPYPVPTVQSRIVSDDVANDASVFQLGADATERYGHTYHARGPKYTQLFQWDGAL